MSEYVGLKQQLYAAIQEKSIWYEETELPKLLEEYRAFRKVLDTIISVLIKKGLIQADPYKLDKKVTSIAIPDEAEFSESERAVVLGIRLSEYESTLEYLCNYYKFSIENLAFEEIKRLMLINNYFSWAALASSSAKPNNKALNQLFGSIRASGEQISISLLHDSVNFMQKTQEHLNEILNGVILIKKELYKVEIRKKILDIFPDILENPSTTPNEIIRNIKKHYQTAMGKTPFYSDLVEQLVKEETSPDKQKVYASLIQKNSIPQPKNIVSQVQKNIRPILFDAVAGLSSLSVQYEILIEKIDDNHRLLQSEHSGFWDKLVNAWRKMFKLPEKIIEYKLKITEATTGTVRIEHLPYLSFIQELSRRTRLYTSFGSPKTGTYQKINGMDDLKILDYINRQISECQHIQIKLEALDEFFKSAISALNRTRIKGIKIELDSLKNILIKINQKKAEYVSRHEEREQMKKLGIHV